MNPSTRKFTWSSARSSVSWRLDGFYINVNIFSILHVWWDIGKKKLKHISIRISKSTCIKERLHRRNLESYLNRLIASNVDNKNRKEIEQVIQDIRKFDNIMICGAKICLKELFFNEFDKPSHYFFILENSQQASKAIRVVITVTLTVS